MISCKKIFTCLSAVLMLVALSGCATIVNGRYQNVTLKTRPPGAKCVLHNNKGTWFLNDTPGSANVHRSFQALHISCHKPGYATGNKKVASHTKAMIAGNILFGGIVGAGIDSANGAGFSYPNEIVVPLRAEKTRRHKRK